MYGIILSAGYGTRLYPLTLTTPKALLPIHNRPVIEFLLDRIKKIRFKKVLIVTNEKYHPKFLEWLSGYQPHHPLVLLSDGTRNEEERLGAIGDLEFVLQKEGIKDDILLFTSDMIFSFSLNKFLNAIESKPDQNWILLYKLRRKKDAFRYGVASVDELGVVTRFEEKPPKPFSPLVAFGIYYLPRNKLSLIARYCKGTRGVDALGGYFQWLLKEDSLYGYVQSGGLWIDVGDKEQYYRAKEMLRQSRRIKWGE